MTEKVEMAEQTPLKSDTDPQAVAEGGDVEAAKEEKKKRTFFWQRVGLIVSLLLLITFSEQEGRGNRGKDRN